MSGFPNSAAGGAAAAASSSSSSAAPPPPSLSSPGEGWSNGAIMMHPQLYGQTQEGRMQLYGSQRRWIALADNSWSRVGAMGSQANDARHSISLQGSSLYQHNREQEAVAVRALIAQMCEFFYQQGWATGTGGGCCIRVGNGTDETPFRVFVAPSGIQKEDMIGDDMFELDMDGNVVVPPKTKHLQQSACTPLWFQVFQHRPTAMCVIHTHSMYAQLATLLNGGGAAVLRMTHLEMLKGVGYHAYDDMLEIPIIDNRPTEDALAEQLAQALQHYPKCNAVLVRRHGVYVWGDSVQQAKTQCESFDYLFRTAVHMNEMGLDPSHVPTNETYRVDDKVEAAGTTTTASSRPTKRTKPSSSSPSQSGGFHGNSATENTTDLVSATNPLLPRDGKILLLDIEGCTTSISYVKDELFPFVRQHLAEYLAQQYPSTKSAEYQTLQQALASELQQAASDGPSDHHSGTASVSSLVHALMDLDVKSSALKDLQGDMWKSGYETGQLKGHVYSDFKPMLEWMKQHHVQVYIYSSGSIQAQKLLFGYSCEGNLLPYLSGHFDIPSAGNKKDSASYRKIAKLLHVHHPSEIVFVSDAEAELVAARQAQLRTVLSIRPGNAIVTDAGKHAFSAVHSLLQLCGE